MESGNNYDSDDSYEQDSLPTDGILVGDVMTVWPKDDKQSGEGIYDGFINGGFDPTTGNGWKPAVDGMWVIVPQRARRNPNGDKESKTKLRLSTGKQPDERRFLGLKTCPGCPLYMEFRGAGDHHCARQHHNGCSDTF